MTKMTMKMHENTVCLCRLLHMFAYILDNGSEETNSVDTQIGLQGCAVQALKQISKSFDLNLQGLSVIQIQSYSYNS